MSSGKQFSRRSFLRTVVISAGAAATGMGLSACGSDSNATDAAASGLTFEHGVASGDPLSDSVILWTRISPEVAGSYNLIVEVSEDEAFTSVIASGLAATSAEVDYTVKIDVNALSPDTEYFYRFSVDGVTSPVGRTRTLPIGAVSVAKLAVVSCANYPAGYFNVYEAIANDGDFNALVHLGDYIYEYDASGYASDDAAAMGRVSLPANELLTLQDYRTRYAQYHTDEKLQAAHARLPFIIIWDDHEVANDAWLNGADNHDAATEGSFTARKAAAIQAWYEWLPVREPVSGQSRGTLYRTVEFGDLVSLHMLDTRHAGRDEQLDYANYFDATGTFDSARFTADLTALDRQLLGQAQSTWLQSAMAASTSTWQVLGQQILMGRMNIPSPVLLPDPTQPQISFSDYAALLVKAQTAPLTLTDTEQAILAAPAIPYNLDAWDGYFTARETVLATALAADANLVVLSGDTHNAWASDLLDVSGVQVGVEFATASVSSPGLESILTQEDPATLAGGLTQLIAPLKYCNTADRGYMAVSFSPEEAVAEWRFVDTVKAESYSIDSSKTASFKVLPGAGNRSLVQN